MVKKIVIVSLCLLFVLMVIVLKSDLQEIGVGLLSGVIGGIVSYWLFDRKKNLALVACAIKNYFVSLQETKDRNYTQ